MIEYVSRIALALFLTVVVETGIALLFGLRSRKEVTVVACINLITNPVLNCLLLVLAYVNQKPDLLLLLILEACVVVIEWMMLRRYLRLNGRTMGILSLTMNTASFLAGLLIFPQC
jgi:hypothetical protein